MPILATVPALAKALKKLVSIARQIPWVNEKLDRLRLDFLNPVVVFRVRSPKDRDLSSALDLYESKIPESFRAPRADVLRWLDDDLKVRSNSHDRPRDFFFVAKVRKSVQGFVLFHYYPTRRTAFFAYMVVASPKKGVGINEVSERLCEHISFMLKHDQALKTCEKIVLEVEDPRKLKGAKQLEALARIQRFCSLAASQSLPLVAFAIDYSQPNPTGPLSDNESSPPLLLLSARTRNQDRKNWAKNEVADILDFIFNDLYPEGFSFIEAENEAFKRYCNSLLKEAIQKLPDTIEVLNPSHLRASYRLNAKVGDY